MQGCKHRMLKYLFIALWCLDSSPTLGYFDLRDNINYFNYLLIIFHLFMV